MGITNSNKELSAARINCDGSFQVELSLTAVPDIVTNSTDIVLILDRSGSMAGSALANMKSGAKAFIDIISNATGGTQDGEIGSGSRIGIVSFADTAVKNTQLITSGSDGVDAAVLEEWASKPSSAYVAITPDDAELEDIFADLARNISNPGATDIVVTDKVSPCFRITAVSMPTKGTASLLDNTSVQWKIDELGVSQSEGACWSSPSGMSDKLCVKNGAVCRSIPR